MEEMCRVSYVGRGVEPSCPLWAHTPLSSNLQVFTNPEAPETPSFHLGLMEAPLNRCDQLVHCLMVTETQSLDPPSPHLESDGVELKISIL